MPRWFVITIAVACCSALMVVASLQDRGKGVDRTKGVVVIGGADGISRATGPTAYGKDQATPLPPVALSGGSSTISPDGDPEQMRLAISRQVRDPTWAPQAENSVRDSFAAAGWTGGMKIDCRSTACEVTGELGGLTPANLRQTVEALTDPEITAGLANSGLRPDKTPVYTILSQSPLRLSFSRVIVKGSAI